MGWDRDRVNASGGMPLRASVGPGMAALGSGAVALVLAGCSAGVGPASARPTTAPLLVFDQVIVVDVEHGTLLPDQRVVIAGNRIRTVSSVDAGKLPRGAQVVDARGKYLIPGLWDMHVHIPERGDMEFSRDDDNRPHQLLLANGVTGIRDASSSVGLDTLVRWRREILAGTRVGPPRQILTGPALMAVRDIVCQPYNALCVAPDDSTRLRYVIDSLKAAGADMLKLYWMNPSMYFVAASEARRVGIPFGGHLLYGAPAASASDSGLRILDHATEHMPESLGVAPWCGPLATLERCRSLAEKFRRNDTWWVLTLFVDGLTKRGRAIRENFPRVVAKFWSDSTHSRNWLRTADTAANAPLDSSSMMQRALRAGFPLLAGADENPVTYGPRERYGFPLHAELALHVVEGLTPLAALQAATLNPAKFLHATDSLGTVASGKLADLVLLDENPLADITNTTTIRAVVANGRYFDRAALDQLLAGVQARWRSRTEQAASARAQSSSPPPAIAPSSLVGSWVNTEVWSSSGLVIIRPDSTYGQWYWGSPAPNEETFRHWQSLSGDTIVFQKKPGSWIKFTGPNRLVLHSLGEPDNLGLVGRYLRLDTTHPLPPQFVTGLTGAWVTSYVDTVSDNDTTPDTHVTRADTIYFRPDSTFSKTQSGNTMTSFQRWHHLWGDILLLDANYVRVALNDQQLTLTDNHHSRVYKRIDAPLPVP